jgi:hypothetical protein
VAGRVVPDPKLIAAALAAGRRGWAVFPLRVGDKRPAFRDWQKLATTNSRRITRWWSSWPYNYNVGISCGPSGLVIVDLDLPKPGTGSGATTQNPPERSPGLDVLAAVADEHAAALPDTFAVDTPSGGRHLYFIAPPDRELRNTAGLLGPHVDTRAAGGYIVGPDSVVNGRRYVITNPAPVAPFPVWLLEAFADAAAKRRATFSPTTPVLPVQHPGPYAAAALRSQVARVASAPEGTRNDTLVRAAFSLGTLIAAGVLDRAAVEAALLDAGQGVGLGVQECTATIRSGLDAGERHPARPAEHHQSSPPGPSTTGLVT